MRSSMEARLCPDPSDSELLGDAERSLPDSQPARTSPTLWAGVVLTLIGVQAIFGGNAVIVKVRTIASHGEGGASRREASFGRLDRHLGLPQRPANRHQRRPSCARSWR
jgi:hypothetical protein